MLNSSHNEYEHDQFCASQLPAHKTAVNRNATSLLCHVGLSFDSKQVHASNSILMEGAMRTSPIHLLVFHSRVLLDLKGRRQRGCNKG